MIAHGRATSETRADAGEKLLWSRQHSKVTDLRRAGQKIDRMSSSKLRNYISPLIRRGYAERTCHPG